MVKGEFLANDHAAFMSVHLASVLRNKLAWNGDVKNSRTAKVYQALQSHIVLTHKHTIVYLRKSINELNQFIYWKVFWNVKINFTAILKVP